jgi:hypothetical protein
MCFDFVRELKIYDYSVQYYEKTSQKFSSLYLVS